MTPLTPKEKENKKLRDNLRLLHNGVLSAWSQKTVSTWHSLYRKLGYSEELIVKDHPHLKETDVLTFPELKAFLEKQKTQLEERIKQDGNTPTITTSNSVSYPTSKLLEETPRQCELEVSVPQSKSESVKSSSEEGLNNDNNYGLISSPKERVSLFWFQKKACTSLLEGFL